MAPLGESAILHQRLEFIFDLPFQTFAVEILY